MRPDFFAKIHSPSPRRPGNESDITSQVAPLELRHADGAHGPAIDCPYLSCSSFFRWTCPGWKMISSVSRFYFPPATGVHPAFALVAAPCCFLIYCPVDLACGFSELEKTKWHRVRCANIFLEEDAATASAKSDSCVRTSLQRITQTQRGRARHPQHFHRLHARA